MVIGISLMLWVREQSYEMDEKLMKELAGFIDLAMEMKVRKKSEQFLEFRLQVETKKNTVSVKYWSSCKGFFFLYHKFEITFEIPYIH